jgi:hypothetical protein
MQEKKSAALSCGMQASPPEMRLRNWKMKGKEREN